MAEHRRRFFLATKTGERTGDGARAELERSLERLQVDRSTSSSCTTSSSPTSGRWPTGRAARWRRSLQARDEGLVRHIGVTGHGTRIAGMHLRSLERQPAFASVLLPFSYVGAAGRRLPGRRRGAPRGVRRQGVAVQTIKGTARRRWREDDEGRRFSWYEPLTDDGAMDRAVRWVLSHPQVFLNSTSDGRVLPTVLAAGDRRAYDRPADDEMAADVAAHDIDPLFDGAELERI